MTDCSYRAHQCSKCGSSSVGGGRLLRKNALLPDNYMCRHETDSDTPRVLDLGPGRAEVLWWVKASLTLPEGKVPWWNRSWDHVDMQRVLSSVLHRVMSGSVPGHRSQHSPWQPGLCISMGISAVEELCQSGSSLHAPQTVTRPACCVPPVWLTHMPRSPVWLNM